MKDFIVILGVISVLALVFGGIFFFLYWAKGVSCRTKWSSFENQYGLFQDCQIEVGGKWIPAESYYFKQE